MKKNILLILPLVLFSITSLKSQILIGTGKTQISSNSVSLEFGTEEKGIVLPWVTSANDVINPVNGTFIFDTTDKKVKIYQNNNWLDLSINDSGSVDTILQDNLVEKADAKVSIGTPTTTPGILVLEDDDKAMVLPQVSDYKNITSPAAGMMVYDTTQKVLCFYNGSKWTFWKENN